MSAPVRRAVLAGLSACLLLSLAAPMPAQDTPQQRRKAVLEGTHVFRRILYDNDLEALKDFPDLSDRPERTILVVLGKLDRIVEVPGGLEDFVKRGGAVLLASDRRVQGAARTTLQELAGVSISNETVVCFNAGRCYHDVYHNVLSDCPFLEKVPGADPALLDGNPRVATNIPSFLLRRDPLPHGMRVLANLPPPCALVTRDGISPFPQDPTTFMVGGDLGRGRVLVLADHSVFINEMMLPTDTNNVEFTVAAIRWLRGDKGPAKGVRDRVLMVEDGKIQTKFDIPLKSAVIPPDEALRLLYANRNVLLEKAEEHLANLEEDDFFNDQALRFLDRIGLPPDRIGRILLLFGTLAALLYGVYRLGIRSRFRHPSEAPLLAATLGRNLPAGPLVEQRAHQLIRMGNLNEPAARLVARWFERQGMLVAPDGPDEPPVEVVGGWWRRRQLTRQLRRLWRLAAGRSTARLEPAGLWRLQRELDQLDASRKRGEWQPLTSGPEEGRGGAA
jgi:hypothetical protein